MLLYIGQTILIFFKLIKLHFSKNKKQTPPPPQKKSKTQNQTTKPNTNPNTNTTTKNQTQIQLLLRVFHIRKMFTVLFSVAALDNFFCICTSVLQFSTKLLFTSRLRIFMLMCTLSPVTSRCHWGSIEFNGNNACLVQLKHNMLLQQFYPTFLMCKAVCMVY